MAYQSIGKGARRQSALLSLRQPRWLQMCTRRSRHCKGSTGSSAHPSTRPCHIAEYRDEDDDVNSFKDYCGVQSHGEREKIRSEEQRGKFSALAQVSSQQRAAKPRGATRAFDGVLS